jgi:hypothetical protein
LRVLNFLICIAVLAVVTVAKEPANSKKDNIMDLNWLAGTWTLQQDGRTTEETWLPPRAGMMLGISRTIAGDKTVEFEFLRIEQRGNDLVYIAQPGGQPPTEFRLDSSGNGDWVFANLKHDFPKKIRYRRAGDGSLVASVEDESGKKKIEFPYRKAD